MLIHRTTKAGYVTLSTLAWSILFLCNIGSATAQTPVPLDPYSKGGGREFFLNGKVIPRAMVFRVLPVTLPLPWMTINSLFGLRNDPIGGYSQFHPGVDLASPTGAPVYSTAYGRVSRAGMAGDYGNLVEVIHGLGFSTRYGHLSAINVSVGDIVDRNTIIGLVGATGHVTGPHLHYEIRYNGNPMDPVAFIISGYKLYHNLDDVDGQKADLPKSSTEQPKVGLDSQPSIQVPSIGTVNRDARPR